MLAASCIEWPGEAEQAEDRNALRRKLFAASAVNLGIKRVFRDFGEAVCARRNILTERDIVFLKNHLCCHFIRSYVLIGISSLFSLPKGLEVERIELQGNLLAVGHCFSPFLLLLPALFSSIIPGP
jgi:hypothetical protein